MLNAMELKEKLQALAQNDFQPSGQDDLRELIPAMLEQIGATDSTLRDDLIYSAFAAWILGHKLIDPAELRDLLHKLLGEGHIFYRIGEQETDSVFRRSFSVLLLPLILIAHRAQPFLAASEIVRVKEGLLAYLKQERDRRDFVPGKGWAHAVAHTADALDDLAQCRELDQADLREILVAIRAVVCVHEPVYTHGEDERFVTTVIAVVKRSLLPEVEITEWIHSFEKPIVETKSMPQGITLRANIKNFLQSLYFRLDWAQSPGQFSVPLNQTLQKISLFASQPNSG